MSHLKRDPESDWLPHCIHCDGRHTSEEPCVTDFIVVGNKGDAMNAATVTRPVDVPITSPQAAYLKHVGELIDVKVTIRIVEDFPVIYIRDSQFRSFDAALARLQHIAGSEVIGEERP